MCRGRIPSGRIVAKSIEVGDEECGPMTDMIRSTWGVNSGVGVNHDAKVAHPKDGGYAIVIRLSLSGNRATSPE